MSETSRMMPRTAHFNGWRDPKNIRWHLRNLSTLPSLMVPRGGPSMICQPAHRAISKISAMSGRAER